MQFDPITPRQRDRDRVEDCVHNGLGLSLVEVRVLLGDLCNQFPFLTPSCGGPAPTAKRSE